MTQSGNTFDYIIIGGGSAGCVLANRLSAVASQRVCLLEAGPRDRSPFIRMPLGILMVLRSKKLNWHYWTASQPHCDNREMYWPRGRTLGGSSAINAMCYVRGNSHDYDQWAELGNKGWSYKDVLPYFIKMEHFSPGINEFHGTDGPMNIDSPRYLNPLMSAFVNAGQQAGYARVEDYNAQTQEGVGYFYVTQKNGQRCSNAQAYLHPIQKRKNLTVITSAQATQILFDKKRATGVRYVKNGREVDIFTTKEVILSSGAIGSPQLLLLSGIGPRAEIEKHGIPLIHDLPGVGQNLQDHLDIHLTCLDKTRTSLSLRPDAIWRLFIDFCRYLFKKRGELTSNYTQAVGFIKSDSELKAPDLQWHFAASMYTNSGLSLKPIFSSYGFTLMTCYLHPQSRGRLALRSKDPMDKPLIDPNYLENEADLAAMVTGFKKARELLQQPAFTPYFFGEFEPGAACQTEDQIRHYIRKNAQTIYHPIGTCKMGTDPIAVVDPTDLKVYGLENLRVIDASVMPTLISGNTNAPTTMIAEKGADMILDTLTTNTTPSLVQTLRANFNRGFTKPLTYRQQQLSGLARFLKECEGEIEEALYHDLKKSSVEAFTTEINMVASELRRTQKKLASWIKPKRVSSPLITWPAKSRIYPEPLGLVLIIAPWNYPVQLLLSPLIGAIAAGNCAILKSSEFAPATGKLLAKRLPDYLDESTIRVIDGGVAETSALLKEQFDYIFYTGGGTVGRIVMEAAAKHLTPVSLELGGKSPCIVDKDADLSVTARRIVWGKFLNAGQTCVAPDYVLAHVDIENELVHQMKKCIADFWGNDPQTSADYGRIINAHHYDRLINLIPGNGEIFTGGQTKLTERYIAPTILRNVYGDSPIMSDEIFGPILPVLKINSIEEAITYVNARPKPLALYLFTKNKYSKKQIIEQTSSGGVCVNHVMLQLTVPDLPFGGVGASGMGAYHGKATFQTFSHYKSVLSKPAWFDPSIAYPPYHKRLKGLLRWLM